MSFHDYLLESWQRPKLLTAMLWPLSGLYRMAFAFNKMMYRLGWKKTYKAPVPVIVVGNLTVGGTGKTPMVIYLVEQLRALGLTPGIISRGYHGEARQYPLYVTKSTPINESGDEPALIVRRTNAPMVVGPDRKLACEMLLQRNTVNVIISDDGLQHHALARDIEICVTDNTTKQHNTCLLPAGPYRESVSRLNTVDFNICHHADMADSIHALDCYPMHLQPGQPRPVLDFIKDNQDNLLAAQREVHFDVDTKIHAVAGIGNPQRFFNTCTELGYDIEAHSFADHHRYTEADFMFAAGETVLMTEKDAVKCAQLSVPNQWYLPVDAKIEGDFIDDLIRKLQT